MLERALARGVTGGHANREALTGTRSRSPRFGGTKGMTMTSQATTKVTTPSSACSTLPRAADVTGLPPNTLARSEARNGLFAQRNRSPQCAWREEEHARNVHANYSDPSYRRRFVHDRFRPEQIARALRATKGGIAAASKMLGCTRNTVLWYLGQYPELRETAQDEVVRALDRAEHSLFPDAASGDPGARRFLLLARQRTGLRDSPRRRDRKRPTVVVSARQCRHRDRWR